MLKHKKDLNKIIKEIEAYNTHFCNHVGQHTEGYIIRGVVILQAVLIVAVIFFM